MSSVIAALKNAVTWLRGLSHSSLFPWPALHFEGTYALVFTLLIKWPHHWLVILLTYLVCASLHELVYDVYWAIPTVSFSEAKQNLLQYLPGPAFAVLVWLLWFR